ncbi:hypothetical protein [Streptomyces decoyicus]|uniref:hypothetical protein n=1 Tax=Streptomyces decoyicus TaxID=249567 RepID=UPI0037FFC282
MLGAADGFLLDGIGGAVDVGDAAVRVGFDLEGSVAADCQGGELAARGLDEILAVRGDDAVAGGDGGGDRDRA